MKTFLLTTVLLCFAFITCQAEPPASLVAGHYTLSLTDWLVIPHMSQREEANFPKESKLQGILQIQGTDIVIETHMPYSTTTTPKMFGRIKSKDLYLWTSGDERDHIVTYHLTGVLIDDHSASGDFSIFTSHEKVASGKWSLTKDK